LPATNANASSDARRLTTCYHTIRYEVSAAVATITLDDPDTRNAISVQLTAELNSALEQAIGDPAARVIVVRGAGSSFSVGANLAVPRSERVVRRTSWDEDRARLAAVARSGVLLHRSPKPTLAVINGACAGAGLAIAIGADLRLAREDAKLNTAFISAGLSGDAGLIWYLSRILGPARTRELCLLPEKIDGREAERIGLVTKAVAGEHLDAVAAEWATRLASAAPLALAGMKQNLLLAPDSALDTYVLDEAERLLACAYSPDADEAAAAFMERREPRFVGHATGWPATTTRPEARDHES
jgi:2-(1,2-epoxy-1,2-dihydrophenyl)acetyl-CoA isomerase